MSGDLSQKLRERRQSFRANVVALEIFGVRDCEIADRLGVSVFAVQSVLQPKSATKKAIRKPRKVAVAAQVACEVPFWVPDNLVGTYQDLAAEHGEEHAASVVRRLKAGARP